MLKREKTVSIIVFSYFLLIELFSDMLGIAGYAVSLTFTTFLAYFRPWIGWKQTSAILIAQTIELEIYYILDVAPFIGPRAINGLISMITSNGKLLVFAKILPVILAPIFVFLDYSINLWIVKKLKLRERVGIICNWERKEQTRSRKARCCLKSMSEMIKRSLRLK